MIQKSKALFLLFINFSFSYGAPLSDADNAFLQGVKDRSLNAERVEKEKKLLREFDPARRASEVSAKYKASISTLLTTDHSQFKAEVESSAATWINQIIGPHEEKNNQRSNAHRITAETYVMISLAMPDLSLKNLFKEANGNPNVVFVLRGWELKGYQHLVRELFKKIGWDIKNHPNELPKVNVIVDSRFFRTYKVTAAPVYLHKSKNGKWGVLRGEISIKGAVASIDNYNFPTTPVGPLYSVTEPDLVDEINRSAKNVDWESIRGNVANSANKLLRNGKYLPPSKDSSQYYVDVTAAVKKDIYTENGILLAPAGTEVNPLRAMTLKNKYIAFNPMRKGEVEQIKKWITDFPNSVLMGTTAPEIDWYSKNGIHQIIYPLQEMVAERLGLISTPSIVEQDGDLLKVSTVKISD